MLIKFVDIDCVLCSSYPCALFESLSHVINQKFRENLTRSFFEILKSKFELNLKSKSKSKSELGKFIPNFPLKM